jgi:hypothetical protein
MKRRIIHRAGRVVIALFIALAAIMPFSTTAYAIDLPDSLEIKSTAAFHDLIETGDTFIVFHGKVNYDSDNGTYPTTPASLSIMLRFYADNGTQLASAAPYVYSPFENAGYGDFVSGFYLTANESPTWGAGNYINIVGKAGPEFYSPVPTPSNYTLISSDYTTVTGSEDNQLALYIYIMGLADAFNSIYTDVPMKSVTDIGTVLSAYGEAYFKSALPGLEDLCPDLFYIQVYTPEVIAVVPYDKTLADTSRIEGSDLERGMNRLGVHIGVSGVFMWGIVVFVGTIALCIFSEKRGWGIEAGMAVSSLLVILIAMLVGDTWMSLMMIVSLIAALAIMWILFLRRA